MTESHTDFELIERMKRQDREALQLLYERYYECEVQRIHFFLRGKISDPLGQAEGLVGDVFIKVWTDCQRFTKPISVPAWIHKICVNSAINLLKREQRWESLGSGDDEDDEIADVEDENVDIEEEILEKEKSEILHELFDILPSLIDTLPSNYSIALSLWLEHNRSESAVAEILDKETTTVRNWIRRSKQKLIMLIKRTYPHLLDYLDF